MWHTVEYVTHVEDCLVLPVDVDDETDNEDGRHDDDCSHNEHCVANCAVNKPKS